MIVVDQAGCDAACRFPYQMRRLFHKAQQLLELANVGGNFASAVGIPDRQPQAVGADVDE